jgi:uncharacterized iron-regulated membrane protein
MEIQSSLQYPAIELQISMLKKLRSLFFWLHLAAGCIGGLIVLLMSVTGVLLTYERQILASQEWGAVKVQIPANAQPLPIEDLLQKANISGAITLRRQPDAPIEVNRGKEGILYLDPYTAAPLGSPSKATREFMTQLRGWHRWLALEGTSRPIGKAITGACTLGFLFLVLSGLYIWLPRKFTWQHFKPILWFRSGLSGKARDFNWHNAIGIWSAIPLALIILSALPISYPWANQLIYDLTATQPPKADNTPQPKGPPTTANLNTLLAAAQQQQGWQSITFRPAPAEAPITFTIDRGDGGQPHLRSTLILDRSTAATLKSESFDDFNLGRKIRSYSRFLHTGESLGILGQTAAGLFSLGGAVLVYTGIALAWRRLQSWQRSRQAKDSAAVSAA